MSQPFDIDSEEQLMKQFFKDGSIDIDSGKLVSFITWARNFNKDLTGVQITFNVYNETSRRYTLRIVRQ